MKNVETPSTAANDAMVKVQRFQFTWRRPPASSESSGVNGRRQRPLSKNTRGARPRWPSAAPRVVGRLRPASRQTFFVRRAGARRGRRLEDVADLLARVVDVPLGRHVGGALRRLRELGVERLELSAQHRLDLAGVGRRGRAPAATTTDRKTT